MGKVTIFPNIATPEVVCFQAVTLLNIATTKAQSTILVSSLRR